MSQHVIEGKFGDSTRKIYESIRTQYLELIPASTEETFVRDMFGPIVIQHVSGDSLKEERIQKKLPTYREHLIEIACAYLGNAIEARANRRYQEAWSFLLDARYYASSASYAGDLRRAMPQMESEAAKDAIRSSKSKGGQKTNAVGRLLDEKAIELIREKADRGESWPNVRAALKAIEPSLWQFVKEHDPDRKKSNFERSMVERLLKRIEDIIPYLHKSRNDGRSR